MNRLLEKLKEGDLRTTSNVDEVVNEVMQNPKLFAEVFDGLSLEDPGIRMRAADALEKISSKNPGPLGAFKADLIKIAQHVNQKEVQWHLAQLFNYLNLDRREASNVFEIMDDYYMYSKSNIVRVFSFQTMADLAVKETNLQDRVKILADQIVNSGSPSLKSRLKKLQKNIKYKFLN